MIRNLCFGVTGSVTAKNAPKCLSSYRSRLYQALLSHERSNTFLFGKDIDNDVSSSSRRYSTDFVSIGSRNSHNGIIINRSSGNPRSVINRILSSHASPNSNFLASIDGDGDDDSTLLETGRILELPPNLKIDQKSTCSPFYGRERISKKKNEEKRREATDLEEEKEGEAVETEKDVEDPGNAEDQEYVDDSDEDDPVLYSLERTALNEDTYVVPLPDRLQAPVYSLSRGDTPTEETDGEVSNAVGTISLSPWVFGQDPIRTDVLHRVVVYQRNKKRGKRYPALTKTVSTRSGSGKKVRPQKGSGQARAGHRRAAHWRGGAKAHGPKGVVQDYTTKLNKKVRRMGLRHALSQKLREQNLLLLVGESGDSTCAIPSYRTGELAKILYSRFDVGGRHGATALWVDDATASETENENTIVSGVDAALLLACRNLRGVKVVNQLGANVYDILKYEKLILSLAAVEALEARLAGH